MDPGCRRRQLLLEVENAAERRLDAVILLIAETKSEGHDGIKVLPRGLKHIELSLGPNERKQVSGKLHLNRRGDSHLVVYPLVTEKRAGSNAQSRRSYNNPDRPNKAPEPTRTSVTPRALAGFSE